MTYFSVKLVYYYIFKYIHTGCRGRCHHKRVVGRRTTGKNENIYIKTIRSHHSFVKKDADFIDLFRKRVGRSISQTSGLEIAFFANEWVQKGILDTHSYPLDFLWGGSQSSFSQHS